VGVQRSERSMRASRPSSLPRRRAVRAGHQLVLPFHSVKALRPPLSAANARRLHDKDVVFTQSTAGHQEGDRPRRLDAPAAAGTRPPRPLARPGLSSPLSTSDSMVRGAVRRRLVGEPGTTCLALVAPAFRRSSPARLTVAGRRGLAPRTAAGTPTRATPGSAWRKVTSPHNVQPAPQTRHGREVQPLICRPPRYDYPSPKTRV
jgi:hypothetical protein